ncbi:hypothetical protein [Nocardioides panaciterrulae]|uniref:Uncharacterized protein n=1 Tax=Nocardioides panaciterrulae TaxID=661492 RepID=A0A7Y9JCF3_9ACTN|nr:hypothetical protein [Nocardioides panaciterrulae]NYD42204.1 hypothetical protein [Nocardioides panaciterrulae]
MESTVRPPRLLVALLAASVLVTSVVLTVGLVRAGGSRPVAGTVGGRAAPRPAGSLRDAAVGPAVGPAAGPVAGGEAVPATAALHAWDRRRARAWARGDVAGLRALYVAGSRAGAHDAAMLRAWVRRGLRVRGMETQLLRVRVRGHAADRLALMVTDRLTGAVAVGGGRGGASPSRGGPGPPPAPMPLPVDAPSTRRVVLVRQAGAWRVASVRPWGQPAR